jgi:hypothetical protein
MAAFWRRKHGTKRFGTATLRRRHLRWHSRSAGRRRRRRRGRGAAARGPGPSARAWAENLRLKGPCCVCVPLPPLKALLVAPSSSFRKNSGIFRRPPTPRRRPIIQRPDAGLEAEVTRRRPHRRCISIANPVAQARALPSVQTFQSGLGCPASNVVSMPRPCSRAPRGTTTARLECDGRRDPELCCTEPELDCTAPRPHLPACHISGDD